MISIRYYNETERKRELKGELVLLNRWMDNVLHGPETFTLLLLPGAPPWTENYYRAGQESVYT